MRYLQHTYRVAALVLLCGGLGNVFGQLLSADQQKFLDISSKSFSITAQNDRDLRFLDKALENRRIVLLGEFTHGSKEINLAKNRLISYLHERLGFNVLLLESGLGEVYSINFCRGELTSRQMVTNLTGPWQTEEYVDLMHFLKARPKLRVAGFDVQRTGRSFAAAVKGLVKPEDIVDLERRFTELLAKLTNRKASFLAPEIAEKESLIADYRKLRPAIDPQIITSENEKLEFVQKVIDNRIEYLEYLGQFRVDNDYRKRFRARDTLMAQNILWLANEMYPKDKIVISGHNF
ncbi:MAG: erythromycin esterase family protein, partial [Pyrinomonadaceae bacterium]